MAYISGSLNRYSPSTTPESAQWLAEWLAYSGVHFEASDRRTWSDIQARYRRHAGGALAVAHCWVAGSRRRGAGLRPCRHGTSSAGIARYCRLQRCLCLCTGCGRARDRRRVDAIPGRRSCSVKAGNGEPQHYRPAEHLAPMTLAGIGFTTKASVVALRHELNPANI